MKFFFSSAVAGCGPFGSNPTSQFPQDGGRTSCFGIDVTVLPLGFEEKSFPNNQNLRPCVLPLGAPLGLTPRIEARRSRGPEMRIWALATAAAVLFRPADHTSQRKRRLQSVLIP